MTGHNCFWMSSWGSPLLDPKKLQNQQFYKIDWIRKKLLVDVANLATCCHDDYDVLLEVLGTWANAMLVVLLPKLWKSWLAQLFLDVLLWLTLTGPKKASKRTILQNRLNMEKNSWSMLPIWLLAAMMMMCYWEVLGTLRKCYVSSPVAKTLEIMTGTTVFGCLTVAHPYWTQKSFKTNNFT